MQNTYRQNTEGCGIIKLYRSTRWRHKREQILRRDGYIDQEERRYGRMVEAQTVHHIFPVGDYPEYTWEDWNLISLTNANHDRMHDRTTNELTARGVELLCRTARKYGIPIPEKYGGGESDAT